MSILIREWPNIIIVLLFLAVCVWLIKRGQRNKLKQLLFFLVCEAEEEFGSGTGELKYSSVLAKIYPMLPTIIKLLISTKELDRMIEDAVQYMKRYLASNQQAKRRLIK